MAEKVLNDEGEGLLQATWVTENAGFRPIKSFYRLKMGHILLYIPKDHGQDNLACMDRDVFILEDR